MMVAGDDQKNDAAQTSDELSKAIADLDALLKSDATPEAKPVEPEHAADPDALLLRAAQKTADAPPHPETDVLLAHLAKNSSLETAATTGGALLKDATNVPAVVMFLSWHGFYELSAQQQQMFKKRFNQWFSSAFADQLSVKRIVVDLDDSLLLAWLDNVELSLDFALQLHKSFMSALDEDRVGARVGVHFGPIDIQAGQMDGEVIEEAQCLMSLASNNQVVLSAACYDRISFETPRYNDLLQYLGLQRDRFNREHAVYALLVKGRNQSSTLTQQYAPDMGMAPLNINIPDSEPKVDVSVRPSEPPKPAAASESDLRLLSDIQNLAAMPASSEPEVIPLGEPERTDNDSVFADRLNPEPEEPLPTMSHLPSAEKVSKLAEKESKSWAGSAQREMENQLEKDRPNAATVGPSANATSKKKPRYRKPVSKFQLLLGGVLLMVLVLVALPFVMPTDGYANKVAAAASERLRQPVQIGQLEFKPSPMPHIALSGISVAGGALQIQSAQVYFDWSTLFDHTREVKRLELGGVQVQAQKLAEVANWFELAGGVAGYPVRKIVLEQASLAGAGVQFNEVVGEVNFAQGGIFTNARFSTAGEHYSLSVEPTESGRFSVSGVVHEAALPLLPAWTFSDLSFKGEVDRSSLQISSYEGYIFGGKVYGNARLEWLNGWSMDGNLNADMLTAGTFAKVLDGNVNGKARFSMRAATLADLPASAGFGGAFEIKNGTLNGIDLVEVMRQQQNRGSVGGQTRFQRLSGQFMRHKTGFNLQGVSLDADIVNAKGNLSVQNKVVNGQFALSILIGSNRSGATLRVDGSNTNSRFQVTR